MTKHMTVGTNKKAIIVARVSSAKQKDGISFEAQESEGRKHAKRHGLEVALIERIVESAKSSASRTKFHRVLEKAKKEKIGHIIFYQFDRESRNLTDSEANEELIRSGQFVIHYARDNKVFDTSTSDSDFFLRDIQAVTNRQFIRNLSAKVNDSMTKKAEMGWLPTNHVPLGYIHHHPVDEFGRVQKRGTVIIQDPDHRVVAVVKKEFELRAQNFSYDAIHTQIMRSGMIPQDRMRYYNRSAIEKRLKNPFYRGRFEWKGQMYEGKHPLIIDSETLRAVDATFGLKSAYGRRANASQAVFSGGWLRCGECGCQITYDPKTKRNKKTGEIQVFHYYHCSNGKKVHDRQVNMSEEKLWRFFEAALDAVNIPESFGKKIADALNANFEATKEATRRQIDDCRGELDELDRKRDLIFDLFAKKEINSDEFGQQRIRLKEERDRLLSKLEGFQNIINGSHIETSKTIIELAINAKSLWNQRSPIERRMLLDMMLSNRSLSGLSVEFDLKKPFKILAQMREKQDWRPQPDLNRCIYRERVVS